MIGKTIGIVGGGQLGKMLAIAAKEMGFKVAIMDPNAKAPAMSVSDYQVVASLYDGKSIERLCLLSDVVTFEFENVNSEVIKRLSTIHNIPQGGEILEIASHRMKEKEAARLSGLNTPKFVGVYQKEDLSTALEIVSYPAVLKTCQGGYDGKGQCVIKTEADMDEAFKVLENGECILESFVPFDHEISVIVVRSITGEISVLPVGKNIHRNNILHTTQVPAPLDDKILNEATEAARQFVLKNDFYGPVAIELFVAGDEIFFNEFAPRPHNSGHWSIEGCYTSQFEQHIRSVVGMPLGDSRLLEETYMINLLGQHIKTLEEIVMDERFKSCKLHLYGKEEAKENRKMGHISSCEDISWIEDLLI